MYSKYSNIIRRSKIENFNRVPLDNISCFGSLVSVYIKILIRANKTTEIITPLFRKKVKLEASIKQFPHSVCLSNKYT